MGGVLHGAQRVKKESKIVTSDPMHTIREETSEGKSNEDFRKLLMSIPDPEKEIDALADEITAHLASDGWPNPFDIVLSGPDGDWRAKGTGAENRRLLKSGYGWATGARHIECQAEPLSEAYFCARMATEISRLRDTTEKWAIVQAAYWLGRLHEQAQIRHAHLKTVKSRVKSTANLKARTSTANQQSKIDGARRRRIARRIARRIPDLKGKELDFAVTTELAEQHGIVLKQDTVRKMLKGLRT